MLLQMCLQDRDDSEIGQSVSDVLSRQITTSMSRLSLIQRAVLSLRCFNRMSFRQIAQIQQRRELRIRLCFITALRIIKRELLRQGFSKNMLPHAIAYFGRVTAPSENDALMIDVDGIRKAIVLFGISTAYSETDASMINLEDIRSTM